MSLQICICVVVLLSCGTEGHIERYAEFSTNVREYILHGAGAGRALEDLKVLCDTFGPRPTGSKNLERAIDFLKNRMIQEGLENVHTEDVDIMRWERGEEEVQLLKPFKKKLAALAAPGSPPTPLQGVYGRVQRNESFNLKPEEKELQDLMLRTKENGGLDVKLASRTLRANFSIDTPHIVYVPSTVEFAPSMACLSRESIKMLNRLLDRKIPVEMFVKLLSTTSRGTDRNLIAEIKGSSKPDEIVLIVAHIDSWDVGQGAMDNGGGVILAWRVLNTIKELNLRPKRTIRVVLFTGEEQGFVGSTSYYEKHRTDNVVFVLENDAGAFKPSGLHMSLRPHSESEKMASDILNLLAPINASKLLDIRNTFPEDSGHWLKKGIPGAFLDPKNYGYYFSFHHTEGDTVEVFKNTDLDYASVLYTTVAYVIADMDELLEGAAVTEKVVTEKVRKSSRLMTEYP